MTDLDRDDDRPLTELPAASVTVYPDGPLVVRGDYVLRQVDGTVIAAGSTVALCRCGRSAAKPFCDGSHGRPTRAASRREAAPQDASDHSSDS